jgi:hypothetical protein
MAFSACKKENFLSPNDTINGTVLDTNQLPIKDAKFTLLYRKYKSTFLGPGGYKDIEIKSVQTDENGRFELKFHKVKNRKYIFNCNKDGYLPDYNSFPPNENDLDIFLASNRILILIPK